MKRARREFLQKCAMGAAALPAAAMAAGANAIMLDPKPLFDISPYLYMQFFEPLGTADPCAEAAWDYEKDDWRPDLVETTRDLSPGAIRWGGILSRYYKWREGVGPAGARPPMRNYAWGGKETNRIGTHEFVGFCRRVGAEPLYCVNFLGDGVQRYAKEGRAGDATEAADWVSYANDPDNRERRKNGVAQPYNVRLWQIGNETSYGNDCFSKDESISHTIEFARAMRRRDASIQLIGWGDHGRSSGAGLWAGDLVRRAGEHLDYVAIHMMGMRPRRQDTLLWGMRYQRQPEQAWQELRELSDIVETRVVELEQVLRDGKAKAKIAITEGHLSLSPHNSNPILTEWLSAVYHARTLNIYQRHGDMVRIATGADYPATRWTVGSVMMQVPRGKSWLLPVGAIMRLFARHNGKQGIAVSNAPAGLDIAASRTGGRVYLHVANLEYSKSIRAEFSVSGMTVAGGRVIEIAPEDPRAYVNQDQANTFAPKEKQIPEGRPLAWTFPARSVSAVELQIAGV
jgi:alpha-L-arabinofuranosidase